MENNFILRVRRYCVVVLLCVLTKFAIAKADQPLPADVLKEMVAVDSRLMSEFTLAVDVQWASRVFDADSEPKRDSVIITRLDDTWAYEATAKPYQAMPRYVKSAYGYNHFATNPSEDMKDKLLIQRPIWTVALWETIFAGVRHSENTYVLAPGGSVISERTNNMVRLRKPLDPLQDLRMHAVFLATGRCFSRYIDSIKDVVEENSGLLLVDATGRWPSQSSVECRWRLEIDPQAQYLVRKATAFVGGDTVGTFENFGTLATTAGSFPALARHSALGRSNAKFFKVDFETQMRFTSFADRADVALLNKIAKKFRQPYPDETFVYDDTGPETRVYTVESKSE